MGEFIEILPPMKRVSDNWYMGTADAFIRIFIPLARSSPNTSSFSPATTFTRWTTGRCCSSTTNAGRHYAATLLIPPEDCARFGVVEVDADSRITGFDEKPKETKIRSPYNPAMVSVSMGVYLFNTDV